jgi:hypothetical protein
MAERRKGERGFPGWNLIATCRDRVGIESVEPKVGMGVPLPAETADPARGPEGR